MVGRVRRRRVALRRAVALGGDSSDKVCAHGSRFLADITLTIHGDRPLAAALFERSLQAARRLGEPHVLARTLLMAGWVPFWSNDLPTAGAMFREALVAARSAEGGDPWGESRALVGIANVISPAGDEEEALRVGLEALAVGEDAGQAFTAAVAHETVAASLRRLMRLDEGLKHSEAAIRTFRELGARWELASALGDRGATYRLAGRLEEAETDLREAFVLCRDLQERALVTWTAAELARILATRGDLVGSPGAVGSHRSPGRRRARVVDGAAHGGVPGRPRGGDEATARMRPRPRSRPRRAPEARRTCGRRRCGGRGACSDLMPREARMRCARPAICSNVTTGSRLCASPIWPPTCGDRARGVDRGSRVRALGPRMVASAANPGACDGVGPVANPSLGPIWVHLTHDENALLPRGVPRRRGRDRARRPRRAGRQRLGDPEG